MTPLRFRVTCLLSALMAARLSAQTTAAGASRPDYAAAATPEQVLRQFGDWLDQRIATGGFSGAVAIARDGKILRSWVAGMADEQQHRPNKESTRFELASTGKMFTAVAVAQLLEQGKLALTDTVGRFLPDYPNARVRSQVTVAQLLAHTSGLGNFLSSTDYAAHRGQLSSLADYVPLFAGDSLAFPPGTAWSYSNSGYIVLGRIIESVSGMTYYDYVEHDVFERAGMHNSGFYSSGGRASDEAIGYFRADTASTQWSDNLSLRERHGSSAGGGYSTLADLVAFMDALTHHRLVSEETLTLFTTPKTDDGPFGRKSKSYGYGFVLRAHGDSVIAFGHTGGFPGTLTQAFAYPHCRCTLVVLANRSDPTAGMVMGEAAKAMGTLDQRTP